MMKTSGLTSLTLLLVLPFVLSGSSISIENFFFSPSLCILPLDRFWALNYNISLILNYFYRTGTGWSSAFWLWVLPPSFREMNQSIVDYMNIQLLNNLLFKHMIFNTFPLHVSWLTYCFIHSTYMTIDIWYLIIFKVCIIRKIKWINRRFSYDTSNATIIFS